MAVPKKKMSKSKRNIRRYSWRKKVLKRVLLALSFGNLVDNGDISVEAVINNR